MHIQTLTSEELAKQASVIEHFNLYGVVATSFNLKQFALETSLSIEDASVLLANLEDENVIRQIAQGDYDSFDIEDESIFNDCYFDMMEQLGFFSDEEDEE